MRNMKQRVVALFLCLVMTLTSIGVVPMQVSATAGSTISGGNWGGGTTNVTMSYGIRFLLVDYDDYKCWTNKHGKTLDLNTSSAKLAKMKSDIKDNSWGKDVNRSKRAIYVGMSSKNIDIAVTNGAGNSFENKTVRSFSWGSVSKIVKKMAPTKKSKKVVSDAFKDLSNNQGSSSKWQNAFNKLEKMLLSTSTYNQAQSNLRKAFRSYNSVSKDTDAFDNDKQYYLIMEPIIYIKRGSKACAVSAQDLYSILSYRGTHGGSTLLYYGSDSTKPSIYDFVTGGDGVTLAAGSSTKLRNLSTMLYQKQFSYTTRTKVTAKGNAVRSKKWTYSNGNTFQFYNRGGYAAIIPVNKETDPDFSKNIISAYQTSLYAGQVGDNGNILTGTSGAVITDPSSVSVGNDDNNDYYLLNTSSYLLTTNEETATSLSTFKNVMGAFNSATNNLGVRINWSVIGSNDLNLGQYWGTSANSIVTTSNGADYTLSVPNANSATVYFVGSGLVDEAEIEQDGGTGNSATDDDGTSSTTGDSSYSGGDAEEDDDEADDEEEVGGDTSDMGSSNVTSATLTALSSDINTYGYSYNSTAGSKWIRQDVNMQPAMSYAVTQAKAGASNYLKGSDGFTNITYKKGVTTDDKKYVNSYVPFTTGVIVKRSTINSYGYQITYDAEKNKLENGTIKSSNNNSNTVSYKTFINNQVSASQNSGWFKGDNDTLYVVAVRNTFKAGNDAVNYVQSKLNTSSADAFVTSFNNLASDPNLILKAEVEGGDKISVGAESTGSGLTGYTVVFIGIKGDIPLTGNEVLEAYQLNNIDPDMAQSFANAKGNPGLIFKSRENSTYLYFGNTQTTNHCNIAWSPCLISGTKSYDVRYFDKSNDSSNKYTIKLDNDLQNTYLIATMMDTAYYNIHYRSILKSQGGNYNSSEQPKRKFTYAFNLVRSLFEDKRASSFYPASDTMYANGNTGVVAGELKMQYSNVPPTTVKNATKVRDSQALVGSKLTETIKWTGVYTHMYDNNSDGDMRLASHNNCNCGAAIRHVTNSDWIDDSIKPFKLGNLPMKQAKIIVTEYAKKYQTANIELTAGGTNKNADGILKGSDTNNPVSSMKAVDINDDSILDDNTRYAYVEKHNVTGDNITLSFYPEVKMMLYSFTNPQEKIIRDSTSVFRQACYVMGERKRNVQSSSLYLYRVSSAKSAEGVSQKLKGTVYSDDMSTGTAGNGNGNTPVIYAGGNVSMKIDGANLNLNLYGYSVDLINKDKDATMKINATEAITYNSIIADNSDVYSTWGNGTGTAPTESTQLLFTDYKNWVKKMTDSKNYGADVTLKVGTGATQKSYNNFNTTVGKIKYDEATQTKEEGVYPLTIMNGKVFTARQTAHDQSLSRGYWSLVAQIQKDYNCTEAVAVKLLEESKMFDSIYTAIESSVSGFNKSGKIPALTNGTNITNELGNDKNWYDEVVRTFCVRRYVTDTLHIDGTMLSDKIDFDAAPTDASVSSGINDRQNSWNVANAKWYVSFYFLGEPNAIDNLGNTIPTEKRMYGNGLTDSGISIFYNPSDTTGTLYNNALSNNTLLTDKIHIDGADFVIPSATTNDESN